MRVQELPKKVSPVTCSANMYLDHTDSNLPRVVLVLVFADRVRMTPHNVVATVERHGAMDGAKWARDEGPGRFGHQATRASHGGEKTPSPAGEASTGPARGLGPLACSARSVGDWGAGCGCRGRACEPLPCAH